LRCPDTDADAGSFKKSEFERHHWRVTLIALVAGLAVVNATGVYAQLVAAHVGERGAATSAVETQDAALAARIDVQAHTVADLDRRLGQIDLAIESQRRARAELMDERRREAGASWPPCRPNAPAWPPEARRWHRRRRRSATSPSSWASTPTASGRSAG
jgi:hypothetical protein